MKLKTKHTIKKYNNNKTLLKEFRSELLAKFPNFTYFRIFTEKRMGGNIRSKFWCTKVNKPNVTSVLINGFEMNMRKMKIVNWINKNKEWNKIFKAELHSVPTPYGLQRDIVIKSIA